MYLFKLFKSFLAKGLGNRHAMHALHAWRYAPALRIVCDQTIIFICSVFFVVVFFILRVTLLL